MKTAHENKRKELWMNVWQSVSARLNTDIAAGIANRLADAALKAFDERFPAPEEQEPTKETPIAYQKCPSCDGNGSVLAYGFTDAYTTCTLCNGNKIIVPSQ